MFDEQWQFAVEVEREYAQYRKKVMMRYRLSAAEVDILLFLANNSQFDLATDIVRVRKMQKSHVLSIPIEISILFGNSEHPFPERKNMPFRSRVQPFI